MFFYFRSLPTRPNKIEKVETPKETPAKKIKAETSEKVEGKTAKVKADNGKEYEIQYKVLNADEITASHNLESDGVYENKKYPAELQPRKRERVSMQTELISMANNLNAEDLMASRNLNQGAPIVRDDGVVLNGNGRTAAIKFAYENGKAENYRQAILDNAQSLGLDREGVAKIENPILIREIVDELSQDDLQAITESKTGGVEFGASEQAKIDAKKISDTTLEEYVEGDLITAANREFVNSVLRNIANRNEINAYTTADGDISAKGIRRVKDALFALAYDDDTLINKFSESTNIEIKNVINALENAAPKIAQVKSRMQAGTLHNYDLSVITSAVAKFNELVNNRKMSVADYLVQGTLPGFGTESAEKKEIVKFLDAHKRSEPYITDFLKGIAEGIEKQGYANMNDIFAGTDSEFEAAPIMKIIKDAEEIAEEKFQERKENRSSKQISLFDETPAPKKLSPKEKPRIFRNKEETDRELYEAFGITPPVENSASESTDNGEEEMEKFVDYFDDSDENLARLEAEFKKELGKISANPAFNPKVWTLGLEIGGIFIQRGINKIAAWAKQMTNSLGEESKQWHSAIWETLKTLPRDGKFNSRQQSAIAEKIGSLFEDGVTNYSEIENYITDRIEVEDIKPLIQSAYNGIKKFFDENVNNQQDAKNKSVMTLPQGYKTESGKNLSDADKKEFIIKPDGTSDFGYIDDDLAKKANDTLEKMETSFRLKTAPVRLQVGSEDIGASDGFGYKHIMAHSNDIKAKGFDDIISYINHILENFNQIYKSSAEENRIILYCKGDSSKGLIPLDLELEKGEDDYYTIVTAYPRRRVRNEETLLVDTRPTNVSTDAVSVPRLEDSNNLNGVASQRDIAESNVSSEENITQSENEGKKNSQTVPIKFPSGRTIYESYKKDKDFLEEKIGASKVPRWHIIEGKISEENSKLTALTINGKNATEVFKVPKLTPGQRKKFDENMSRIAKVDGKEMTRLEVVEGIAKGELEESALKLNKGGYPK